MDLTEQSDLATPFFGRSAIPKCAGLFSLADHNTASFTITGCRLYVDDALLFLSQDPPRNFNYELNLASCKFGRPSDCFPYLAAYFHGEHSELALPE